MTLEWTLTDREPVLRYEAKVGDFSCDLTIAHATTRCVLNGDGLYHQFSSRLFFRPQRLAFEEARRLAEAALFEYLQGLLTQAASALATLGYEAIVTAGPHASGEGSLRVTENGALDVVDAHGITQVRIEPHRCRECGKKFPGPASMLVHSCQPTKEGP